MARANYCEFFRFHNRYCDVFCEDDHYLYASAEPFGWPHCLACKEFKPTGNNGWIVSPYDGADAAYLASLEPAPEDIAQAIIDSEERYTLEYMAVDYGYTQRFIVDRYLERIESGDTPHEAFLYCAGVTMEKDW